MTEDDVGKTISIMPTEKQAGYHDGDELFSPDTLAGLLREARRSALTSILTGLSPRTMSACSTSAGFSPTTVLSKLREEHKEDRNFKIDWLVGQQDIGMEVAPRSAEIPASEYQSVNSAVRFYCSVWPLPRFGAFWRHGGLEPSTPVKFALGLLQLGLGFAVLWYGACMADSRGMVAMSWLCLAYLLHTTAELCLSPVGLSMITKLSPLRLVSTMMGVWFLATAYSQYLASIVAQFTDVTKGASCSIPPPVETVHVYGHVWGRDSTVVAVVSAAICFALAPILNRWMHTEADAEDQPSAT